MNGKAHSKKWPYLCWWHCPDIYLEELRNINRNVEKDREICGSLAVVKVSRLTLLRIVTGVTNCVDLHGVNLRS
jgi:hypothetical protein